MTEWAEKKQSESLVVPGSSCLAETGFAGAGWQVDLPHDQVAAVTLAHTSLGRRALWGRHNWYHRVTFDIMGAQFGGALGMEVQFDNMGV